MAAPLTIESRNATPDDVPPLVALALAGRYRVVRRLSSSAMSDVYQARQLSLGRDVAVKVLSLGAARDADARGRFAREARTQAALAHPCIVPVHDHSDRAPVPFFVMTYVEGESLARRSAREARGNVAATCRMLAGVAEALDFAHRRGVVHRDVKPSNILVEAQTGRGLLTDFGVAIVSTSDHSRSEACRAMGTPGYMAPEQILGEQDYDGRGDLYSLGAVAFQLFAGRLPFAAATPELTAARQVSQDAPPLESFVGDIPPRVADVVNRCLARDARKRWADGRSLAAALREAASASDRRRGFAALLSGMGAGTRA